MKTQQENNPGVFILMMEDKNEEVNDKLTDRNETGDKDSALFRAIIQSKRPATPRGHVDESSSLMTNIGIYLGGIRRRQGLSITEVASLSGFTEDVIARIELGLVSLRELDLYLPTLSIVYGKLRDEVTKHVIDFMLN